MRLLTNAKIDSTQKTFEKWDNFLKKAIYNLGFKKELAENIYPYEKGIPMLDGSFQPIPKTGRTFYQLSWADKLAQCIAAYMIMPYGLDEVKNVLFKAAVQQHVLDKMFSDPQSVKEQIIQHLEEYSMDISDTSSLEAIASESSTENVVQDLLWKEFLKESNIYVSAINSSTTDQGSRFTGKITADDLLNNELNIAQGSHVIIINRPLQEEFSNFDNFFAALKSNIATKDNSQMLNWYDRLNKFGEVYCQDYLVISMNPIDKLMLSTKQAFGSCMSIAKQNDTHGTQSHYAFGLPAMLDCDNVFLIFVTSGKHKNMYWSEKEWNKEPSDRDKDQAYKYLKMNCRALTYRGTLTEETVEFINDLKEYIKPDRTPINEELCNTIQECLTKMKPEQERLFVGRQYAAAGEDFIWQEVIELLMAEQGISTGMAYATWVTQLRNIIWKKMAESTRNAVLRSIGVTGTQRYQQFYNREYCRKGDMHGKIPICYDRFGFARGFYYDNLSFSLTPEANNTVRSDAYGNYKRAKDIDASPVSPDSEALITVGSSRSGSGGISGGSAKDSRLDMFKLMTGEQNYSFYNAHVKVCSKCGQLIEETDPPLLDPSDKKSHVCNSCIEKLHLIKCPSCNKLYDEEHASEHEMLNIRRFINPRKWQDLPELNVCKSYLKQCTKDISTISKYLCAHCGKIHDTRILPSHQRATLARMTVAGVENVLVGICQDCLKNATMCSRCKKLVFLDNIQDACVLLPHQRIICPDCIDSIRMRQEKRAVLKDVLQNIQPSDLQDKDNVFNDSPEAQIVLRAASNNSDFRRRFAKTPIKDVIKQIKSYLQAHPEIHYPTIKEADPTPAIDEEIETSDRSTTLEELAEEVLNV